MPEILVVFGSLIAALALILHYVTKWKQAKTITPEDEATLSDLRRYAEALERRMETMERILDDEVPDWRQRRHDSF